MKLFNLWLSSLLLGLITITTIGQSREYHVKDSRIVSYMYKRLYDIKEKIFPADIRINVSVSRSVGTLLYSIDKNMNQLIVSLHDGITYVIKVELNKQEVTWSLTDLCGCERCRYEILDLRIQLNTHINIRCNNGNTNRVIIINKKELNENYPILFPRMNTSRSSTKEAHLWLVNTPQYENVYPNNKQMYGCIFKVSYMNKPIYFTNITSDITHPCIKSCSRNVCNGGECLEAYNDYPVCNCTTRFLNGPYCNESIHPMNLRSSNQLFIFDMIKLSWNSSVNTIFTINNSNVQISLDIVKENIFFELTYLKNNNNKIILSLNYVRNNPSICIVYFKEKMIDIWLFNDGSWSNGQILSEYDLRREIFDSLALLSGNGNISLYTKSNEDYAWKVVHIVKSTEIKNKNISGNNINLEKLIQFQVTMNNSVTNIEVDNVALSNVNSQSISTNVIIAVSVTIPITIIITLSIITVIIFFMKRNKDKNEYQNLKEGSDFKDIQKEHEFQLYKKEHKEYIKICKLQIGYDIVKQVGTYPNEWFSFIQKKIKISHNRLERMYEVMKNLPREDTYLGDIIILLIHTRICAVPPMPGVISNQLSIKYLAAHLSDKYNHKDELQGLSEQVIECMMDFLEDLSQYNDPNKTFHKLLDEMLAFVGYNIVINKDNYKYRNKRDVTFLVKYSSEDHLERLWSAVIMFAHTRDPKHITTLKEYLNANFLQGENVSNDMIIIALATPRLCADHNFEESILTDIDYLLIVNIKKYKILSKENIEIFTVNIINIFNHKYKEGIIESMKANSDLTKDQKISIKCFKSCLQRGFINEDKLILLTSFLDEFYPFVVANDEADSVVKFVLSHFVEHKHYRNETMKVKLYNLCIQYFHEEKISDGIKISSSMIICYTAANMTNKPRIDDVIEYLSDIIGRMIRRNSEAIHLSNYTLQKTEIEQVIEVLKLMTPEQDKPKDQ